MSKPSLRNAARKQNNYIEYCSYCNGLGDLDADDEFNELLTCTDCKRKFHPVCSQLPEAATKLARTYNWQCNECKSCLVCEHKTNENELVFCSSCDRGCHTFCVQPPLPAIPKDDWFCEFCAGAFLTPLSMRSPSPTNATASYNDIDSAISLDEHQNTKPPISEEQSRRQRRVSKKRTFLGDEEEQVITPPPKKKAQTITKIRVTVCQPSIPNDKDMESNEERMAKEQEAREYQATFGHKLTLAQADSSRGRPQDADRRNFEKCRKSESDNDSTDQISALSATELFKIKDVRIGDYTMKAWFVAPYPEEYTQQPQLYICEFCFKYMASDYVAGRHKLKCAMKHPPGDEIYRDGAISIFEVDGRKNKMYCQNLCLIAKMFLDHKTLYYDVEPFLFYIMTEVDEDGCHFVGYFSKEKCSAMNYNVSCILTLPCYQRKGYGQYLIDFSYLLTKREGKTGTPERPLSDLGLLSYRSYWRSVLFRELRKVDQATSVEELSSRTSLTPDDIISCLQLNDMLFQDNVTGKYQINIHGQTLEEHAKKMVQKNYIQIVPDKLTWTPFILSKERLASITGEATPTKINNCN